MVNKYQLQNPYLKGNLVKTIEAKNSIEAGNILYKNLSEHINNSLPSFHFTIKKGSSKLGKLYHFEVKEKRNKDNEVNYEIKEYKIENEQNINNFYDKLNKFKSSFNKEGGSKKHSKKHKKHKKDKKEKYDSSDSDSSITSGSSDYYRRVRSYLPVTQPIYYWWYDPYLYSLDTVYIPTFYSYVTPYIQLALF